MYKKILLAVDLNEESSWRKAMPTAVALAGSFDAALHVLTVVPEIPANVLAQYFPEGFERETVRKADTELKALCEKEIPAETAPAARTTYGNVYDEILRVAGEIDADLIVMASHRPELGDYLLGPNAARVVRHCDRSVLVVRE